MSEDGRAAEIRRKQILALTELIYDAAIEPSLWQRFSEALSEACGDAAVAVVLRIAEPGAQSYAFRYALDPSLSGVMNRYIRRGLPWTAQPHGLRYEREFVLGSDYFDSEELAATDFYRDFMEPQGLAPEVPLAVRVFAADGMPYAAVALYQRVGYRALNGDDVELCNALVPHLRRGYEIHRRLHQEREQRKALAEIVDRFPIGVMLIDHRGRVVSLNTSAQQIVDLDDAFSLDGGHPMLRDERSNAEFQAAVVASTSATGREEEGQLTVIAVERSSGGPPITLGVAALLGSREQSGETDPVAAVFIADPDLGGASLPVLEDLYELTPAESALVGQLVTGRSVEEIAGIRGIQPSTARGYLKNVYRKTGANSQRELVRLVLTGVSPIARPAVRPGGRDG